MSFRIDKSEARRILLRRDRDALLAWANDTRDPFRSLISLTYDGDELVRWRAIEATGWVAATYTDTQPDKLNDTLRRLFWLMNDESGGLAWHAPELIGEILLNAPSLIPEYLALLISFLKEEPFERGTHHALCRIGTAFAGRFHEHPTVLHDSLNSEDPYVRCLAAITLTALSDRDRLRQIAALEDDQTPIRLYDFASGELKDSTVGAEVARAGT